MENIVDLIVNNGIGVACIVYFMFRDYKFMQTLQDTLSSLRDSVAIIQEHFLKENNHENSTRNDN